MQQPFASCPKCKRVFYQSGEMQGGRDDCPHSFVPIQEKSIPQKTPFGLEKPRFIIPHVDEVKEKDNINTKVDLINKIMSKLELDQKTLDSNHVKTEDDIDKLFKDFQMQLDQRRDILIHEAKAKYTVHHEELEKEIDALEQYKKEIGKALDDMCESALNNQETPERISQNVRNMQAALKNQPTIREIPVDIRFEDIRAAAIRRSIDSAGSILLTELKTGKYLLASKKVFRDPNLPNISGLSAKRNLNSPKKIDIKFKIEDYIEELKNNNNNNDEEDMNRIEPLNVIMVNSRIEFECWEEDINKKINHYGENYNNEWNRDQNIQDDDDHKNNDNNNEEITNVFKYSVNIKDIGLDKSIKTLTIEHEFNLNKIIIIRGHIIYARNNKLLNIKKPDEETYAINNNQIFISKWSNNVEIGYISCISHNNDKKYFELTAKECNVEMIRNRCKLLFIDLSNVNNNLLHLNLKDVKDEQKSIKDVNDEVLQQYDGDLSNIVIVVKKKIKQLEEEKAPEQVPLLPNKQQSNDIDKFVNGSPNKGNERKDLMGSMSGKDLMGSMLGEKLHFLAQVDGQGDKRRIKVDNDLMAVRTEIRKRCKIDDNVDFIIMLPDNTPLQQSEQLSLLKKDNKDTPPLLTIKLK